jgi:hypothetical protein
LNLPNDKRETDMETMKRFLAKRKTAAMLALCAALFVLPASGMDRGKQLTITRKNDAARLMDAVENAAWATDGNLAQKPVYIVYNTECPWSKQLFEQTRALAGKVQLRWIPATGSGAGAVTELRNTEAVGNAFAGRAMNMADAAKGQRAVGYNWNVQNSINYQMRGYDKSKTFAYPTLIYQTAQGVKVVAGIPQNLATLPDEVLSQPSKANLSPAALAIVSQPMRLFPSRNLPKWYHTNSAPAIFRAAPDPRSAPVDDLAADMLVPVSGIIADSGWIEIAQYGPAGSKAYVHDPRMAKMALLDFRVKPQGGVWNANAPFHAFQFPHAESPALEKDMPAGGYRRTGVVELEGRLWDQIVVYANGGVGYVPRS